jgi:hypothetical protein
MFVRVCGVVRGLFEQFGEVSTNHVSDLMNRKMELVTNVSKYENFPRRGCPRWCTTVMPLELKTSGPSKKTGRLSLELCKLAKLPSKVLGFSYISLVAHDCISSSQRQDDFYFYLVLMENMLQRLVLSSLSLSSM